MNVSFPCEKILPCVLWQLEVDILAWRFSGAERDTQALSLGDKAPSAG